MRRTLTTFLVTLGAAAPAAAEPLRHHVGNLHAHTAYSDGWPGTRPADVFAAGRSAGLRFTGISDHSDNLGIPLVFNESCYGQGRGGDPGEITAPRCLMADQVNPADSLRKWDATQEQVAAATTRDYAPFRGFEWSSDRFGHINVFFSRNWTSAYTDGGFADLATFWNWFTRPAAVGGGSDGLGTFNHPDAKKIGELGGVNWNGFEHVPAADPRMVGIEVFNDDDEFGSAGGHPGGYPEGAYARALDKGWHVGAIGAEDLGHRKPPLDDWGGPSWPKTVLLAPRASAEDFRQALLERRFYAVGPGEREVRLDFTVDDALMGTRLGREDGEPLRISADASDPALTLELVTSGGEVVATGARGRLRATRRADAAAERWYFVRARREGRPAAYSSPVWIEPVRDGASGEWLAGDLHAHTCYSHDVWCPPEDDNTGPETFYSSFGTVAERFAEAAVKGLDYLMVSDHDDVRAHRDPGFGTSGVLGLHGYESSLPGGHAHLIGARARLDKGPSATREQAAESARALADAVGAAGGLLQANHPSYRADAELRGCDDLSLSEWDANRLHWKYGFEVEPDSIEVWNPTSRIAPAELFWECWLQRGARIPATGGSDTHGANGLLASPTTWVFSAERSERAILRAIRAGRTTLSRLPPGHGGGRLLLEADADGDGTFEALIGDTVPPGSRLRVRADGLTTTGLVRVRANGTTLLDGARLEPGAAVELDAPAERGWVRAVLTLPQPFVGSDPGCAPGNPSPLATCTGDLAVAAMTSPIYLGRPGRRSRAIVPLPRVARAGGAHEQDDHGPDEDAALAPAVHSRRSDALPAHDRHRHAPLGLTARRRDGRLTARWTPPGRRFDVAVRRRSSGHWHVIGRNVRATRLTAGGADAIRVRVRSATGRPGPWVTPGA